MKFTQCFAVCLLVGHSFGAPPDFVGFSTVSTALESATGSISGDRKDYSIEIDTTLLVHSHTVRNSIPLTF